jgi:hypothetical protein
MKRALVGLFVVFAVLIFAFTRPASSQAQQSQSFAAQGQPSIGGHRCRVVWDQCRN